MSPSSSTIPSSLFNPETEKPFIAAIIRKPELLADCPSITVSDFSPDINRVVFSAIQACLASGAADFSKFKLIDRLNSLGVGKLGGVIEPGPYINALELLVTSDKAAIGLAKEIKRTSIRRETFLIGQKICEIAKDDKEKKSATQIVSEATKAFNEHVNMLDGVQENEPVDMYGTIDDFIDRENPFAGRAVVPPWNYFTDWFGFWDGGTAPHLVASRMKIGKSSFWLSTGLQLAKADKDDSLRILVLDTELSVAENQSRSLAQVSGLREFLIRQDLYKRDRHQRELVEAAADVLRPLTKRVSHHYCGHQDLNTIASVIRRWAFKNITDGKRGLIVYDYIKLMGNDFRSQQVAHIQVASKMELLKNLCKELTLPCICFCQTNRENIETKAGDRMQNTGVIGGSDMLVQFCSNAYLLQELFPEERAALGQLGPNAATHSLKDIATRQWGENKYGEYKTVKYKDEKGKDAYCKNYLLFNFHQYNVVEVGTFRQIWERSQVKADVQGNAFSQASLL